jgi:hypothetical protein
VTRRPPRSPRIAVAIVVVLAALVLPAGSAGAVTPRPTDDRSTVTDVQPPEVVSARVIGGDSLLTLTAAPGHEVVILGYAGEPYLRIPAAGSVEVNANSAAVALNRSRDADTDASGPSTGGVDWQPYQSGRTAIWHDHRIHVGEGAELAEPIDWQVPITVDGTAGHIDGRLERLSSPSPLMALLVGVAAAALVLTLGRRRPILTTGVALASALLIAAVTGFAEWHTLPSVVARNAGLFLLPVGAAVALAVGLVVHHRTTRLVALLASISLLAGWIAFRWSIVTRAVLISDLDPTVDRVALALVAGAAVGAAGLVVRWAGS